MTVICGLEGDSSSNGSDQHIAPDAPLCCRVTGCTKQRASVQKLLHRSINRRKLLISVRASWQATAPPVSTLFNSFILPEDASGHFRVSFFFGGGGG